MFYLLIQTWFWVLLAFLLGLLIGWLMWRGNRDQLVLLQSDLDDCLRSKKQLAKEYDFSKTKNIDDETNVSNSMPESTPQTLVSRVSDDVDIQDDWRPMLLDAPENDKKDDLKRVSGIGKVLEKTLNKLGIYHFRQIANFTPQNIAWVDDYLSFKGRIQRENWVEQAAKLDRGEPTDFSNRYDKGEM